MLPRKLRLGKSRNFDLVYRNGKFYPEKNLLLFVLETGLSQPRCGISVSKKVSKKAVERNKLKRQIASIFREEAKLLKKNVDLIFVARTGLIGISFSDLKTRIGFLLKKAELYVEQNQL